MLTNILKTVSYISLLALIIPSVMFLYGNAALPAVKVAMLVSTIVWFVIAPFWMKT